MVRKAIRACLLRSALEELLPEQRVVVNEVGNLAILDAEHEVYNGFIEMDTGRVEWHIPGREGGPLIERTQENRDGD